MAQNIDISKLQSLGFSENDARVYLCLADLKSSTADQIISKTGLHRSIVYTSLDHLLLRKLVEASITGKKKIFTLISPGQLVSEFEEKALIADEVSKLIDSKLASDAQEITIYRGNEEYLQLLVGLIKALPWGATKYVLGTGGKEFMDTTMLPIWGTYHRAAKKHGIAIKMIAYNLQGDAIDPYVSKEGIYETRYLASDMENPAGIHIYPEANVVLNILYSTASTEVTAIKIRNKSFVQSHLALFKNLWEKAQ